MSLDDLLLAIIIAGIGLSIAYLRAELVLRQEFKAAERRKELAQANPFQVMRVLVRALRISI